MIKSTKAIRSAWSWWNIILMAGVVACLPAVWAAEESDDSEPTTDTERLVEEVTVTATRLSDKETPVSEVPSRVLVFTRADIAASGARHLQEFLAMRGLPVYDQVGNGVQTTFNLRGFTRGTGTAVYLDGVRINDPRNNSVSLETVPIDAIERIEVVPGSAAAVAGGGSAAGVVMIETAPARDRSAAVTAAGGEWGAWRATGSGNWTSGRLAVAATAARDETDGFRDNAEGEETRYTARLDYDLGAERGLALTATGGHGVFGQPGALTADELSDDRGSAPFNSLDGSDGRDSLFSLNYHMPLARGFSLAANLSRRDGNLEALTTGRAAATFGGFYLETDTGVTGATIQVANESPSGRWSGAAGAEWSDGRTDALGFFTPATDLTSVDRSAPASDNTARREVMAAYAQQTWKPVETVGLTAGLRWDHDETRYDETVPLHQEDSTTFTEVSAKAGVTWNPLAAAGFYASWGESFLPPTVEQMFSFPTFGSNPDLEPEEARTLEAGARGRWGDGRVDAAGAGAGSGAGASATSRTVSGLWDVAVFRIETRNEILFDFDTGPNGTNVNAGRTRREGIEASVRARIGRRIGAYLNGGWTKAEFVNGEAAGKDVPLVPRGQLAGGVQAELPAGFGLRAEGLFVGSQVLDNDTLNEQGRLDSYAVMNLRASWSAPRPGGPSGLTRRNRVQTTVFAEARNLFDRSYSTRGIFAFDFAAGGMAEFFTPAPGRQVLGGVEVVFR